MNLRGPSDRGFPMRDLVPARILTEDTDCTRAEYTARCCAFFTAIFQTLQEDLSSKLPRLRSGNPNPAIKIWNDQMCNMCSEARVEFFQKVRSRYQEVNRENYSLDRWTKEVCNRPLPRSKCQSPKRTPMRTPLRPQRRRPPQSWEVCQSQVIVVFCAMRPRKFTLRVQMRRT